MDETYVQKFEPHGEHVQDCYDPMEDIYGVEDICHSDLPHMNG